MWACQRGGTRCGPSSTPIPVLAAGAVRHGLAASRRRGCTEDLAHDHAADARRPHRRPRRVPTAWPSCATPRLKAASSGYPSVVGGIVVRGCAGTGGAEMVPRGQGGQLGTRPGPPRRRTSTCAARPSRTDRHQPAAAPRHHVGQDPPDPVHHRSRVHREYLRGRLRRRAGGSGVLRGEGRNRGLRRDAAVRTARHRWCTGHARRAGRGENSLLHPEGRAPAPAAARGPSPPNGWLQRSSRRCAGNATRCSRPACRVCRSRCAASPPRRTAAWRLGPGEPATPPCVSREG
jgi:hypothetical protein